MHVWRVRLHLNMNADGFLLDRGGTGVGGAAGAAAADVGPDRPSLSSWRSHCSFWVREESECERSGAAAAGRL